MHSQSLDAISPLNESGIQTNYVRSSTITSVNDEVSHNSCNSPLIQMHYKVFVVSLLCLAQ